MNFQRVLDALGRLVAESDPQPHWQPLLQEVVAMAGAESGQILSVNPDRTIAKEKELAGRTVRRIPLTAGGRVRGWLEIGSGFAETAFSSEVEAALCFCGTMMGQVLSVKAQERDLEQFLHAAAHDIRGNLMRVSNLVQMLTKQDLPAKAQELAARIAPAVVHGDSLLRELVAYAEAGNRPVVLERLEMSALFAAVRWKCGNGVKVAGGDLQFEGENQSVMVSEQELSEVLARLIDNCLRFGGEQPQIRIGAEVKEGEVVISVVDSGPGFDPRYAAQIFEPFQRLQGKQGHGLGLPICRKIVESLGGRIWAESSQGAGTAVRIRLPAAP